MMDIGNWFKRLRARSDSEAVERFEDRQERAADLPEGERFVAGENRIGHDVDHEIVKGELWGTVPTDPDNS